MSEIRLIDADKLKKALRQRQWHIDDIEEVEKIIDNAPPVEYPFYAEAYQTGYEEGKNERPQGECANCEFRKFSERMIDVIVDVMNKYGITSVEELEQRVRGKEE